MRVNFAFKCERLEHAPKDRLKSCYCLGRRQASVCDFGVDAHSKGSPELRNSGSDSLRSIWAYEICDSLFPPVDGSFGTGLHLLKSGTHKIK
jgi:hypothetical protein